MHIIIATSITRPDFFYGFAIYLLFNSSTVVDHSQLVLRSKRPLARLLAIIAAVELTSRSEFRCHGLSLTVNRICKYNNKQVFFATPPSWIHIYIGQWTICLAVKTARHNIVNQTENVNVWDNHSDYLLSIAINSIKCFETQTRTNNSDWPAGVTAAHCHWSRARSESDDWPVGLQTQFAVNSIRDTGLVAVTFSTELDLFWLNFSCLFNSPYPTHSIAPTLRY